ncbi:MAG: hypothetical protein LKE35_05140 [Candidatus Methanomethylophilus sp.]|jgi:hypothetical protein|nr:hypothetical protein [Methanomethylophilus sp.]
MDLTAVDFAVPFSPLISTPPIVGSMTFRRSALFILSCLTILVNGKSVVSVSSMFLAL